jgi:hypothetical protein
VVRADRAELINALTDFLADGRRRLIENVPGIQRNPYLSKLAVS